MFARVLALAWLLGALSSGATGSAQPGSTETPDNSGGSWIEIPGGRWRPVRPPADGRSGFAELDPVPLGILFTNRLAEERYLTNQILLNGSGTAAGDVDGDGWCDLYFCGLDQPNALYRNLGNWRFQDVTTTAGVACAGQDSTGAALADLDGDGDLDLLVNGLGRGTRLFLNAGGGKFDEAPAASGLRGSTGAHSLALADVEGDGDLDVYVVNYRTTTFRDEPTKRYRVSTANNRFELLAVDGRPVTEPDLVGRFSVDREHGVLENGEADVLYLNDGHAHFQAVSWSDGRFLDEDGRPVSPLYDWGLSAMFHDLDRDGDPDLYVCNDFQSPDRIWINDGRGRFRAISRLAIRQTSIFSMGVDMADVDRDGYPDVFVADMFSREHAKRQVQLMERQPALVPEGVIDNRPQYSRNTLLWNRGDGSFAEIAQFSGLEASDWTWCPVFLDVDLDGYEDLLAVTGHVRDAQNIDIAREIDAIIRQRNLPWREQMLLRRRFQPLHTANFAFRNRGDLTFEEAGERWGFHSRKVCQGVALADLDNDGDLDVVVNCLNDGPLLCRNESVRPRVAVRLRGRPGNTRGVGACIEVSQPEMPAQAQEIASGGRYLSSDDTLRVFAAAHATNRLELRVRWRSGARTFVGDLQPNRLCEIEEPPAATPEVASSTSNSASVAAREPAAAAAEQPLFEDVSARLAHVHHDEGFNDFERQPLLPHRLSQLGPGVSWFDLDGDGWEDLLVGAGRGGRMGAFRNDRKGGFVPWREAPFEGVAACDQTTLLGWQTGTNHRQVLAGLASYEATGTNLPAVVAYDLVTGAARTVTSPGAASVGPLALADVDRDGDLDLFVGGRVVPGQYPRPADSMLLRNQSGQFTPDSRSATLLAGAGLVSGALFTDLDDNGFVDLVLACEWGPLRLFRNVEGQFREWLPRVKVPNTGECDLAELTGWWNSVAAGDFDGDGRMDLVAGNWGRNTRHESHLAAPLEVYSGDLDGDGFWELLEAYHASELGRLVPLRDWGTMLGAIPALRHRYGSYTAFSTASVSEILGASLPGMLHQQVRTFQSLLLLNRGDSFEARPLPDDAQFSPVFGMAVADFNGDGNEDVVLAQNFFGVSALTSRLDAGLGVLLEGDGRGGLSAVPASRSGLRIHGEGRGVAAADFDQDGRVEVVVGQNAQTTRLFHNRRGAPGLRVRLQGGPENPGAVGTRVRLVYANNELGPVREIRAGGGYWSQDSATVVLGKSGAPTHLSVRWPDGGEVVVTLETRQTEVSVTQR